ncbi:hypothetical protein ASE63_12605 [Bosea sp. Root381]|uniref:DUF6894 family protein n=1 Tax=Bosea sp. Root381 TaxID=1736524 RepID=UPI000701FBC2|nr:hypothetical protein [Bosea sp. Root381]KRD95850.1 hypothetical protein ASE63_12605 [Bosea sp. Root381]
MPRYFIDTSDGDRSILDEEGIDLADDAAARLSALDALPDMARDVIPDGDERRLSVSVRNAEGEVIYHATLTLAGHWERDDRARAAMPDGSV